MEFFKSDMHLFEDDFSCISLFRFSHHTRTFLMFHNSSKFINGTELCKQYGKKFVVWCRLDTCQELIRSWKRCYGDKKNCFMFYEKQYRPGTLLCSVDTGSDYEQLVPTSENKALNDFTVQGTYIHPYFVPFLMQWLDPSLLIVTQQKICKIMKLLNRSDSSSSSDSECEDHKNECVKRKDMNTKMNKEIGGDDEQSCTL